MSDHSKAPEMEQEEIDETVSSIRRLRSASKFEEALIECASLIATNEGKILGFRTRAHIYAQLGQINLEVEDRKAAIDSGSKEPVDHFDLGICLWKLGRHSEALHNFVRAIEIGQAEDFHYYTPSSRIHAAALLLKMDDAEGAKQQCALIPEGFSSYLPDGMTTKEDLVSMIESKLGR